MPKLLPLTPPIQVLVFQYSFWLSLFLMFLTAATRVSLFGILYLLLGLFFLYRGQDMLRDRQRNRRRRWVGGCHEIPYNGYLYSRSVNCRGETALERFSRI